VRTWQVASGWIKSLLKKKACFSAGCENAQETAGILSSFNGI